ncbi:MAG: hypothetical protein K6T83_19240 [Alicyclobacillus sp.]|nr:hypothetical protein [Alicyclobacillus sp.]
MKTRNDDDWSNVPKFISLGNFADGRKYGVIQAYEIHDNDFDNAVEMSAGLVADRVRLLSRRGELDLSQVPFVEDHMGAVIVDGVLQSGLNYKNTVLPRVEKIKSLPEAKTVSGFLAVIVSNALDRLLSGKDGKPFRGDKPRTIVLLTSLLYFEGVDTADDFRTWIVRKDSETKLKSIPRIGDKTVDYLKLLVGIETVAIDVRLRDFLIQSGGIEGDYAFNKEVFLRASTMLGVSPRTLDSAIWQYMNTKNAK